MKLTIFSGLCGVKKKEESFCYFAVPSSIFPLYPVTLPDYKCNSHRGEKYLHKIKVRYKVDITNTILYQIKKFQIIISLDICFTQNDLPKILIIHYFFQDNNRPFPSIFFFFFSEMCVRGVYDNVRKKALLIYLFIYCCVRECLRGGLPVTHPCLSCENHGS